MFKKLLIANRGEIAVRVMRTCRDMGMTSVAVYSEADATALHARYADEAYCIGPAPAAESYLNAPEIIKIGTAPAAPRLSIPVTASSPSSAEFGRACAEAGIIFVGPSPETLHYSATKSRRGESPTRPASRQCRAARAASAQKTRSTSRPGLAFPC